MIINKNSCISIVRHFDSNYEYKNSNVEWMKGIPKSWNLVPLKFVTKIIGGGTPSKANSEYWIGKIPWVSPKDMKSEIIVDSEDHISKEAVENSSTSLISSESVLLVVRSGILRHSIPVAINARPVALNQDMKAIIPLQSLKTTYLKYFISGHQNALLFEWRKEGATVESIEHELLANTKILIPSIAEQRAISIFLDHETAKIDALIAKKERLIELLQEKRAALISHAVTKGLDPSAPMKDSGVEWLGEIPEHWEVKKFRRLTRLKQGLQIAQADRFSEPGDNRFEYITIKSIHGGNNGNMEYIANPPRDAICHPEDVLLSRTGATGEVISEQLGVFHNNFFKVEFDENQVLREYLIFYLSNSIIKEHLLLLAGTTTIPDLNHGEFLDTLFIAPLLTEQSEIIGFLNTNISKINLIINKILEAIDKLKEYRSALISAAVTGKIDVREAI